MEHREFKRIVPGAQCALLFIHGICGSPAHFRFLWETVPENISLWSLLLDGHGGSAKDFAGSSMDKWRRQVDEAIALLCAGHSRVLVVGHSMGTLLALENAIEKPHRIKGLFLLASPLRIHLSAAALKNSLGAVFRGPEKDDPLLRAAREGCSVELCPNPLVYLRWLPPYAQLLALSARVRRLLPGLETPCRVFLSRRDELVSLRSADCFRGLEKAELRILENSMHYYYSQADRDFVTAQFMEFVKKEEA